MNSFLPKINQEYTIRGTASKPYNSIWKITTPQGSFSLKRFKSSPHYFTKLITIINDLSKLGFNGLVPIILTKKGLPYIEIDGLYYSLSPWCEGEPPSFTNPNHLIKIAECYGRLHEISRNINFPPELQSRNNLTDYFLYLDFLESLIPSLEKRKNLNRIDRTILKWGQHFIEQSRLAIQGMKTFQDRQELFLNNQGFCHNDPAPGNIIIKNEICFLIDFEFSNRDLFIKELSMLILRALQVNHWNERILELLIKAYSQERKLIIAEEEILPYLLCFPRRFWRLCSQRYQEKLKWTENRFQKRLWEIIDEEKNRQSLLKLLIPELEVKKNNDQVFFAFPLSKSHLQHLKRGGP